MHFRSLGALILPPVALAACASVPSLPDRQDLPIRQILLRTACELREAFIELDRSRRTSFDGAAWLVGVSITPKVNQELTASAGLTSKSTANTLKPLSTFALGAAPGAQLDLKGHSDGSVTYNFHSKDLLAYDKFPLDCSEHDAGESALTRNLGVKEWLLDVVAGADGGVSKLAKIDKPTYSSEIFVKLNGTGSYSYAFPYGSDLLSLYGGYDRDEVLSIALTTDAAPKVIKVRTLPAGGVFGKPPSSSIVSTFTESPQQRLDLIQLQQTLRNLPLQQN